MIQVNDLRKSYRGEFVVDSLSFSIAPGEILGLLGPNGAGKSTTVKMLYGLVSPDSGEIQINGMTVGTFPRAVRALIGVVPQEDNLDPDFSTRENLIRFATYYGFTILEANVRADELLRLVRLEEHAEKNVEQLSGGMKRKLVLARSLINKPKALFLDEPTTGLDPDARQEFWKLVQMLKSEGTAILLTTHYMEEAERLCDRVVLIQGGKSIETSTPKDLISKYIGAEVFEVSLVERESLNLISKKYNTWIRDYGLGSVLGVPSREHEQGLSGEMFSDIEKLAPEKILRRPANLEDVFLSLTGEKL